MFSGLSPYLTGILLSYSAFLLAIASPGPNIMAVMGTSMAVGRREGMSLAMGIAFGSLSWGLLTVIGLSALLTQFAYGLIALKVFGGFYLLWLSYKAFKSARTNSNLEAKELDGGRRTGFGYFARGYLIQMTNPKAALAWIAIISLGLSSDAPVWVGMVILSGTFIMSVVIHTLYALAFSTIGMVRIYTKARRWIQGTFSAFFAFAGLKLLTDKT